MAVGLHSRPVRRLEPGYRTGDRRGPFGQEQDLVHRVRCSQQLGHHRRDIGAGTDPRSILLADKVTEPVGAVSVSTPGRRIVQSSRSRVRKSSSAAVLAVT